MASLKSRIEALFERIVGRKEIVFVVGKDVVVEDDESKIIIHIDV